MITIPIIKQNVRTYNTINQPFLLDFLQHIILFKIIGFPKYLNNFTITSSCSYNLRIVRIQYVILSLIHTQNCLQFQVASVEQLDRLASSLYQSRPWTMVSCYCSYRKLCNKCTGRYDYYYILHNVLLKSNTDRGTNYGIINLKSLVKKSLS